MFPDCAALGLPVNVNASVAASQLVKVNVPVPTWADVGAGGTLLKRPPVVS
jgi:hypothetical protein